MPFLQKRKLKKIPVDLFFDAPLACFHKIVMEHNSVEKAQQKNESTSLKW